MKTKVLQENLAKNVSLTSRFTSSRTQIPILGNILLRTTKTKLLISSTNLEISVAVAIGAKIEKEGEITVPARVLSELFVNLPKGTLDLEVEKEQLKVSAPGFSSIILGMNAADFPEIPTELNKDKSFALPQGKLSENLGRVLFAVSSDETRPILTGVLFAFSDGELTLVATDGFRLSSTKFPISASEFTASFVVPKTILGEISRNAEVEEVLLEYREKDKQIVFESGDVVFSSRLLEGSFPDYAKIIPKTYAYKITVDKEDILRAVKLASIFARDNANIVKLKIKNEELIVTAESSAAGNQETKIEAKVETGSQNLESSSFEIAFNYKFLEDFLGSVSREDLVMQFSEADKPGVFLDPSTPDYLHLIMPVKIQ